MATDLPQEDWGLMLRLHLAAMSSDELVTQLRLADWAVCALAGEMQRRGPQAVLAQARPFGWSPLLPDGQLPPAAQPPPGLGR